MFGILVCGDSISFGRGESPNIGWAGRLKKDFGPKGFHNCLFDLGIPGDTSTTLLKRFENEVRSRIKYIYPGDKYIIIIAIGINDSRAIGNPNRLETKPEQFKKNILKLISIAKRYTKHILFIGLTPVNEDITNPFEDTYFINSRIKEYNGIIKDCSQKEKVKFLEVFSKLIKKDYKKMLVDGVHPNKKGYVEIHKIIKNFLIKNKMI